MSFDSPGSARQKQVTVDGFTVTVEDKVKRNGRNQPLVVPPGGSAPVGYNRPSKFASMLSDATGLHIWKTRNMLAGFRAKPSLLLQLEDCKDSTKEYDFVANQAFRAGGGERAANLGTQIHRLIELHHDGTLKTEYPEIPDLHRKCLDAYVEETRGFNVLHSEGFVVLDEHKFAGSFDQVIDYLGENYIGDIKTGVGPVKPYKALTWAMQVSIYAHSVFYDQESDTRSPLPSVSSETGIVIYIDRESFTCQLVWLDLKVGWEAFRFALELQDWRGKDSFFSPFATRPYLPDPANRVVDPLIELISSAESMTVLQELWSSNRGVWCDEYTAAASLRKQQLLEAG